MGFAISTTLSRRSRLSVPVWACLLAWRRQNGSERRFWVLLGLALGAWTFAEATSGVYDLVLNTAVPVPSWADVRLPRGDPAGGSSAVVPFRHACRRGYNTRATLDGLAIGSCSC